MADDDFVDLDAATSAFVDPAQTMTAPQQAALRGKMGVPPLASFSLFAGSITAALGDSITNRSNAGAGRGYVDQLPKMVGSAFMPVSKFIEAGVPGDKSGQALARYDSEIRGKGVQLLLILLGTNDAGQGVPVAAYAANMTEIVMKAKQDGIAVIVGTVPPRPASVATADTRKLTAQYNLWINLMSRVLGFEVANVHKTLTALNGGEDGQDGYFTANDVHPNTIGHQRIAESFLDAVNRIKKIEPFFVTQPSSLNLIINPIGYSAGTKPTGWFEAAGGTGTTPTYSMVGASGVLRFGRWARMDFDATASGGTRILSPPAISSGFSVGDEILITAKINITDIAGNYYNFAIGEPSTADVVLQVINQSGVNIAQIMEISVLTPGPIAVKFTIPSGTTNFSPLLRVKLPTGAHIYADIGELGAFNLTANGMTSFF